MANWHPDAKRAPHQDGGSYESGFGPRLVWHTTEGNGLPSYGGSAPHFTIDPRADGRLWQHIPLDRAARALKGSATAGIATNGAHAIQVEIVGFAGDSDNWPDSYYDRLRDLAKWIEANARVASIETVDFQSRAHPMSNGKWREYRGHCGHQHVPGQDHWDPGEFKVEKVLGLRGSDVRRELHVGDDGSDVVGLQRAINRRAGGMCRPERMVTVDGEYGEHTKRSAGFVGYVLGLGESQSGLVQDGISEYVQDLIRHPGRRNDEQRDRAVVRREKHGNCHHD